MKLGKKKKEWKKCLFWSLFVLYFIHNNGITSNCFSLWWVRFAGSSPGYYKCNEPVSLPQIDRVTPTQLWNHCIKCHSQKNIFTRTNNTYMQFLPLIFISISTCCWCSSTFFVFIPCTHQLITVQGGETLDYRQDFKLRLDNICRKPVFDKNEPK